MFNYYNFLIIVKFKIKDFFIETKLQKCKQNNKIFFHIFLHDVDFVLC